MIPCASVGALGVELGLHSEQIFLVDIRGKVNKCEGYQFKFSGR